MKTFIRHDGTLVVSAETQLEAYALRKWAEENSDWHRAAATQPRVLVNFPAEVIGPGESLPDWQPGIWPCDWKAV